MGSELGDWHSIYAVDHHRLANAVVCDPDDGKLLRLIEVEYQ